MANLCHEVRSSDWPWFGSQFSALRPNQKIIQGKHMKAGLHVNRNGQLEIEFSDLSPWIKGFIDNKRKDFLPGPNRAREETFVCNGQVIALTLNIVIQAIGCLEDVQPLLAIGKLLKSQGHRVRFATHLPFRVMTQEHELEFFNVGNLPTELALLNTQNTQSRRKQYYLPIPRRCSSAKRQREMHSILDGCWRSCYEVGDGTGLHHVPSDPWSETHEYYRKPFVADAIISNSLTLAPLCCAEALNIPLNMVFTSPCFPTNEFSHPMTAVHSKGGETSSGNRVSYAIMDALFWSEFGNLINDYRKHLGLEPLSMSQACTAFYLGPIPQTYLWSPFLLQKPNDWLDHVEVTGFTCIDHDYYDPQKELQLFLKKGPQPLFIGMRKYLTKSNRSLLVTIIQAVHRSGQRAILETGSLLTIENGAIPQWIFVVKSCSHRWLFRHVSCIINHGDATEISDGLAMGRPIITVPSQGNQFFWGEVVYRKGVGPAPIPLQSLSVQKLFEAIQEALTPRLLERANAIGNRIFSEAGMQNASVHFHKQLNMERERCWVCPSRAAVWRVRSTEILLSALAAAVLVYAGLIEPRDVIHCRNKTYKMRHNPLNSRLVKSSVPIRPSGVRSGVSFENNKTLPGPHKRFQWTCMFKRWFAGRHPVLPNGHKDTIKKKYRRFLCRNPLFKLQGHQHTHQRIRDTVLPRPNDTAGAPFQVSGHNVAGTCAKPIRAARRTTDSASIGTFKQAIAKYNVDNPKPGFQAAMNRLDYYTKSYMRRALGQIALPPTEASLRSFCGLQKLSKISINNIKRLLGQDTSDIATSNQVIEYPSSIPRWFSTRFSRLGIYRFRESKKCKQCPDSAICNMIERYIMSLRKILIITGSGSTNRDNVLVSVMIMGIYEMYMATKEEKELIIQRWRELHHSCHSAH